MITPAESAFLTGTLYGVTLVARICLFGPGSAGEKQVMMSTALVMGALCAVKIVFDNLSHLIAAVMVLPIFAPEILRSPIGRRVIARICKLSRHRLQA